MTLDIRLQSDFKAVNRNLTDMQRKVIPPVAISAINKTLNSHKRDFTRNVSKVANIPIRLIKQKIHLYKANQRYRSGLLWSNVSPIPLIKLSKNATERVDGVKVGKRLAKGAFVATMPSGHIGIYDRDNFSRLPISEVKVDVGKVMKRAERRLNALSFREFMKHFVPELERRLNNLRKR